MKLRYNFTMEDILITAALTRQACEQYNERYGDFLPCLSGMCAMASQFLFHNLKEEGHSPTFILAYNAGGAHCWVSIDTFHVDITATQFDEKVLRVFHYTGIMKSHPLLSRFFCSDVFEESFPKFWKFETAQTESDIRQILKQWEVGSVYRGIVKERLNTLYRTH